MGSWGLETTAAEVSRDTCILKATVIGRLCCLPRYGRYVMRAIGDSQTVTSFTLTASPTRASSSS